MFLEERDSEIAQLVYNYFYAVESKWPNAWGPVAQKMILNKSTGFLALMKFFRDCFMSFNKPNQLISKEEFSAIFEEIDINEEDFNRDVYVPGSSGQGTLYKDLLADDDGMFGGGTDGGDGGEGGTEDGNIYPYVSLEM